jgi:hypothetical protein
VVAARPRSSSATALPLRASRSAAASAAAAVACSRCTCACRLSSRARRAAAAAASAAAAGACSRCTCACRLSSRARRAAAAVAAAARGCRACCACCGAHVLLAWMHRSELVQLLLGGRRLRIDPARAHVSSQRTDSVTTIQRLEVRQLIVATVHRQKRPPGVALSVAARARPPRNTVIVRSRATRTQARDCYPDNWRGGMRGERRTHPMSEYECVGTARMPPASAVATPLAAVKTA